MSDPFIGEIRLFGFSRVPDGWLACNGQSVSISEYGPLFSLIGTIYGGDGQTTFNVPDMQGRVAIGLGQGTGLPNYAIGQVGGEEQHTLVDAEIPSHSHALASSTDPADTGTPGPTLHLATASAGVLYAPAANIPSYERLAACVGDAGNSSPHDNMMPTLVCNYCICAFGIFPSQG